jgi:hypothetical protein
MALALAARRQQRIEGPQLLESTRLNPARRWLGNAVVDGALASALSAAVLAWRGRVETGSAAAALNAPSHWIYGAPALRRNAATLRHTVTGTVIHSVSGVFWALFYRALRAARSQPTPLNAVVDAAAVTAVAAVVDLRLVPERLTPGFERRLKRSSLIAVYVAFAAGLAIGGAVQRRR